MFNAARVSAAAVKLFERVAPGGERTRHRAIGVVVAAPRQIQRPEPGAGGRQLDHCGRGDPSAARKAEPFQLGRGRRDRGHPLDGDPGAAQQPQRLETRAELGGDLSKPAIRQL